MYLFYFLILFVLSVIWRECGVVDGNRSKGATAVSPGTPQTGTIFLSVQDSGAGMSEENVQELFKEGVQFHANLLQAGGGSGLGLWISKGIVDMHGGRISGSSPGINKGSTFSLELPVYTSSTTIEVEDVSCSNRRSMNRHTSQISQAVTDGIRRILVVDDSSATRKMVVRLLRNSGYECLEASDGQMCLDMIMQSLQENSRGQRDGSLRIDLVLMDYEMPRYAPAATLIS
jgi:CheY-like chemotaxis protein